MNVKPVIRSFFLVLFPMLVIVNSSGGIFTPSPGFSFATLDAMTGKIKTKLQTETAGIQKSKGKTTTVNYTIPGIKSMVRLKNTDVLFEMLSDQTTGMLNPSLYVSLYKLDSGKSNRILTTNPDWSSTLLIPVNITPTGQLIYRVEIGTAVFPGEYAFVDKSTVTSGGNVTVWTFGID